MLLVKVIQVGQPLGQGTFVSLRSRFSLDRLEQDLCRCRVSLPDGAHERRLPRLVSDVQVDDFVDGPRNWAAPLPVCGTIPCRRPHQVRQKVSVPIVNDGLHQASPLEAVAQVLVEVLVDVVKREGVFLCLAAYVEEAEEAAKAFLWPPDLGRRRGYGQRNLTKLSDLADDELPLLAFLVLELGRVQVHEPLEVQALEVL